MTLNVTSIHAASLGHNVIPSEAQCVVDIRVPLDIPSLEEYIKREILENSERLIEATQIEFIQKTVHPEIDCGKSPWLEKIKSAIEAQGETVDLEVFPAATDSRFYRAVKGLPCFGFSPIKNTPILLHDHNEWISVEGLEKGVNVYCQLLKNILVD